MQSFDTFEYRHQGRRPATYAALALGLVLVHLARASDAPILAWAPVTAFLAVVLTMLALNRAAGLRLGQGRLEVFDGGIRRDLALARISGAEISRHACLLHFTDGARLAPPRAALPPARRLAEELRHCGVPVNIGTTGTALPRRLRH